MSYKRRELNPTFPIHITARSNNKERFLMPMDESWDLFSDYLFLIHKCFNLKIVSFVMMSNHFHLIARDPDMQMPKAMNYFLRETSKLIGKETKTINRIWGGPYHSSVIKSPIYHLHAYKYVFRNPVEAGLSECPAMYEYSTLHNALGCSRGIIPVEPDLVLFENPEATLSWLRMRSPEEEREIIRKALKRKQFKIARDPKTKQPSYLEESSSVPVFLHEFLDTPSDV